MDDVEMIQDCPNECGGCYCHTGAAPCSHCVDHWTEKEEPMIAQATEAPLLPAEVETEVLDEMREFAEQEMASPDPRSQMYLKNQLNGKLVRSEQELQALMAAGVPLAYINWREAIHLMRAGDAEAAKIRKRRAKNKVARASRKRNRS